MNPLRLRARNYRTFSDLDLELPGGCVGITGDNGAGKSTLVGAIDVALFGPETRSLDPYLNETALEGDLLLLELEFEHRGDTYRVRRTYTRTSGGRGKASLNFDRLEVDGSTSILTQGTVADTQALIEQTLGLTRDTFRASAFLAQGDGGSFTDATPRDRKQILADALGLHFWDECKDLAAIDRRQREQTTESLNGRVALLDERLADADTIARQVTDSDERLHVAEYRLAEATERSAAANVEHDRLAARAQNARAASDALRSARAELEGLNRERARADEAEAALADLARTLPELRADAAELGQLELKRDRIRDGKATVEQVAGAVRIEQREIETLSERHRVLVANAMRIESAETPACDRCEQPLVDHARETALASIRAEAIVLAEQITMRENGVRELAETVDDGRRRLAEIGDEAEVTARGRKLQGARERLAAAIERQAGLQTSSALRTSFADELVEAERKVTQFTAEFAWADEPEPGALEQAAAALTETVRAVDVARVLVNDTRTALARAQTLLEEIEKARSERDLSSEERDRLRGELDELQLLERAFGRDGVPTWILETSAIPALEVEADRMLGLLGTDYRVELRTERELKAGGAAETLDVILLTPNGEREYATFSGGERTRLNLALRLALARLLSHRRGAESQLLAIDEPEFLDAAGTERLVDALRDLGQSGEFEKLLLVSHVPALRDAFDTTLNVTKTDGRSEVTVA